MGMHHICASPWLADIMRDTYGGTASLFDLSVDTDVYHPTGFAAAARHDRALRARVDARGARCRWRSWRSRSSSAGGRTCGC